MKKFLLYLAVLFVSTNIWSQTITKTGGWLESAFIEWTPPTGGADSYNLYYTGMGKTNIKIDKELIRNYDTYFRADILGLTAGNYTITIKPVVSGVEQTGTTSSNITVVAHDRSGFAFQGGHIPGAYNLDGTLKTNAVVIYITQNTKNTVSLNVTGATSNPCVGLQAILDGFKKGVDIRPLSVRLVGNITDLTNMYNGDIVIENKINPASSITFEGVGSDAVVNGWGIRIKTASNIEIRNLGFMLTNADEGDNVGLQQDNDHIWVHNCDMFYGEANGDSDQVKGDGALDAKKSTYITFSYNHFWDSGKCNLLGLSEGTTTGLYITYHHNWYDHSDSRHPRVRFYSAHVYNNYYDGNSKYGAGSTLGSSVFMEGNFFRNCKYPMLTSMQGSDVYGGAVGTFSGEAGGTIKAYNNTMSGQIRYMPYDATNNPVEFDAIEVANRSDIISSDIKSKSGLNIYNNFDTDASVMYSYTPDSPADAKDKVMQYAGRVSGGDLKWTFNNAIDDASSAVNVALKNALTTYVSPMIYIQGETAIIVNTQKLIGTNREQTVSSGSAITNIVFTWSGDATDASVLGLPASGIDFVKDVTNKTITVTGTPTANISFTVTTSGTSGTPVTLTGGVTVLSSDSVLSDEIHSFTSSNLSSTFYKFGPLSALSTSKGNVIYGETTLTQCVKTNAGFSATYTTLKKSTLTLLLLSGATIKIDNVSYTATPAISPNTGGVITLNLEPGTHTLSRGDGGESALFYIKTSYINTNLGIEDNNIQTPKLLTAYPNPVADQLYFSNVANQTIKNVTIYSLTGATVKTIANPSESIDVSNIRTGNYLIKVSTEEGNFTQKIIKK